MGFPSFLDAIGATIASCCGCTGCNAVLDALEQCADIQGARAFIGRMQGDFGVAPSLVNYKALFGTLLRFMSERCDVDGCF